MYTAADTAQVLFGLFIVGYGYLLCLDAYCVFGKTKLPKWIESLFLIILGVIILFVSFSGMTEGCAHAHDVNACKDSNASVFLFSILLLVLGIVDLLNQNLEVFSFSAAWVTPAILVVLALLLKAPAPADMDMAATPTEAPEGTHGHSTRGGNHGGEEGGHGGHGDFLGKAFTVSVLSAAVLRALVRVDGERWGVLLAYVWSLAGFAHAAQSKSVYGSLSFNFTAHTIFLGICVMACVMLLPILFYIQYATKDYQRQARHAAKDEEGVKAY